MRLAHSSLTLSLAVSIGALCACDSSSQTGDNASIGLRPTGGGNANGGALGNGGAAVSGGTTSVGGMTGLGGAAQSPTAGAGGSNTNGTGSGVGGLLGRGGTEATSIPGGNTSTGGQAPAVGGTTASGSSTTGGSAGTSTSTGAGGATVTGGSTSTGGAILPPHVCDEPTPWTLPTTSGVVGTGTAASCTYSDLSTKVTPGGSITFNCGSAPVTIAVTSAITVNKDTVVDGGGLVTLDGGGKNQIFLVASNHTLSVRNLTFINGKAPAVTDAPGIGGALLGNWRSKVEIIGCTFKNNTAGRGGGAVGVWTGSSLTIVSSRFSGNSSWYGGAVYSLYSPLQIINCEFTNNSTLLLSSGSTDGGAIATDGATTDGTKEPNNGTIQICGTQIHNNSANGSGGAAYLWMYPPDQTIIDRTTVEGNTSTGFAGAMRISNGTSTIKSSSFLSNTSVSNGGGFYLDCSPTCAITNSTIYANKNTKGWGGAIFANGQVSLDNVTLASNNHQDTSGNATWGGATWTFNNSIFYNNGCSSKGKGAHVLESGSSSSCITGAISGDPKLGAPVDNGGPTRTMLPSSSSAALGAGANCQATDQRGQSRNTAVCDLGAVEVP